MMIRNFDAWTGRSMKPLAAGAVVLMAGLGAAACGTNGSSPSPTSQMASGANVAPQAGSGTAGQVMVNCGPGQQALVRPTVVNGLAVSQVDCVAAPGVPQVAAPVGTPLAASPYARTVTAPTLPAAPVAYQPVAYQPVSYEEPQPRPRAARPAGYRTSGDDYVEYQPRRAAPRRTVKKSAIIIGSSAGIGAAVGAAVKGKKGALIGAAIGGGGAAVWDQVTRNRR